MKLNERPFMDSANEPARETIKTALGELFTCYEEITGLAGTFSQEWNFSKSSGWMLKVFDARKALFYLIPLNGGFKVSMAIRENEREAFCKTVNYGCCRKSWHHQKSIQKVLPCNLTSPAVTIFNR